MSRDFKSILIDVIPPQPDCDPVTSAVRMGLALARECGSSITVHGLSPRLAWVPVSLITNLPARLAAEENKHLDEAAKTCLSAVEAAAEAAGVACQTETIALDFLALLGRSSRKARLQDVVVMDARSPALPHYREIVESMLFRSGRPVILVPEGWNADVPAKIVIAWDASVQATRAIAEALPILQRADTVDILSVEDSKDPADTASSARLATYLDRHGVRATQTHLTAEDGDVADTLRSHVTDSGADMIVMGAYAHSRLQEAFLGGVTRSLLDTCPVPILMAH